jgi:sulfite exporter TauE/SafE
MCGPFAAAASGLERPGGASAKRQLPYHLGRLVTYLTLGGAAGALGHVLDRGGALAGWTRASAWVAGAAMILFGLSALVPHTGLVRLGVRSGRAPSRLGAVLAAIARRAPVERAFLLGLATTFIPCGWLYAFVATAAGTGGVWSGMTVMLAFWGGTLPWLLGATFGLRALVPRLGARVRTATACLIALSGVLLIVLRTGSLSQLSAPAAPPESTEATMPADCPFHPH